MTKSKTKKSSIGKYFVIILLLFVIFLQLVFSQLAIESFLDGILIWATKILPALLPFFILTKLLSYTEFIPFVSKKLSKITSKLYNVGGVAGYVYFMSIISGYPVGAKITADLYNNQSISARQAIAITSFTSTSGPLFVIGTIGIGLFGSVKLGLVVLVAHFLGALINGLIYRNKQAVATRALTNAGTHNYLNESVNTSIVSIMSVGGFVALFYMFLQILISINAFDFVSLPMTYIGISKQLTEAVVCGLFEITTGCLMLSQFADLKLIAIIISGLISFGGFSIHAQAYCFLKEFNMPYLFFFVQKTTHALISILITLLLVIVV